MCDANMAQRSARGLLTQLPADATDAWLGTDGKNNNDCRCFLPYRVTDFNWDNQPTDWELLQAAIGVLRVVVPMVPDVHVHSKIRR